MALEGHMEKKLEEYRARKRKERLVTNAKQIFSNIMPSEASQMNDSTSDKVTEVSNPSTSDTPDIVEDVGPSPSTRSDYVIYFISAVFWLTVYAIAIHLEFGAVYFVISLLFFIWKNTRTGPKKRDEVSAYSVFNPNCEAIDGTLKAEQFEKEIRFGAGSVC